MKQTEIPCPPNLHTYRKGLDKTLQQQQLQDIVKQGTHVKTGKPKSTLRRKSAPLFEDEVIVTQPSLF